MTSNDPATICVYVGLDLVGDGLMKLPFVRALRHAFPRAHITWLAGKGPSVYTGPLAPLVAGLIDEVIADAGVGHRAAELLRRPLSGRAFDMVIDTQRRVLTTLILRRLRCRVFISGAAGFLLSDRRPQLPYRKPAAMIRQMLDLVAVASGRPAEPVTALRFDPAVTDAAARLLPAGPIYIGLAPGAGGRHKCWPLDRYVELAQRQAAAGRVPVILLGPAEAEWAGAFRAVPGARLALQDAAALGIPVTSGLTIALAQRLAVAVANDSGAGHMLAAGDVPLVSLFGPTSPGKFAPLVRRLTVIRTQDFASEAMAAIPVDAVAQAVVTLLSQTAGSP